MMMRALILGLAAALVLTVPAAARERRLDLLGDLAEEHLDLDALLELARDGAPDLPTLPPGADR